MVISHKSEEAGFDADPSAQSPPPYTSTGYPVLEPVLRRVAPPIARCNHVAIKRPTVTAGNRVVGSFVVDPALEIPVEMLAPLDEGEERQNLLIDVPEHEVDADLWVVEGAGTRADSKAGARTAVEVVGHHVHLRVHETGIPPLLLTLKAPGSGNISLALPRSFQGPITIHSQQARVVFSPAMGALSATFSDYGELRKCFVGDFKALGFGHGTWEGSVIDIHAPEGRVKLRFTDEPEPQTPRRPWWDWSVLSREM